MFNLGFSRFDSLTTILTGMATTAAVVISCQVALATKSAQQIAEIAAPITVQINSALGDGSGVIIARQDDIYTVLTVNHVVKVPDVAYNIRTHDGQSHPVTSVTRLQTTGDEPDLAVVRFESTQEYPIATLGDSEQVVIGVQIYVYAYPATGGLTGAAREPELSPGLVTSRPKNRPEGYNLRYQAVTWSGMSGGPVFDSQGRVVGLHGQGEFGFAQTRSGDVTPIKTGFNAAVPINLFLEQLSQAQLNPSDLQIDEQVLELSPVSLDTPQNAETYYFRGLSWLDRGYAWEAIADFNRALELNPNSPETYFNLGLARTLLVLNEPTRGPNPVLDYSRAIELNPGFADAYYNRALSHIRRQEFEEALADFRQAAELYQQLGRSDSHQDALQRIRELEEMAQ